MFKKSLYLAAAASVFASVSVFAQAADSSEDIDQIIVTGARSPLSASQVGSSTTIITRAEIERRQSRYVTDLLRTVPGFSVAHTGVIGSQTQVRVRGSEANHVLVLIDGIRANDPATGDEFRWEHLSTGNIERIEVVRGPQSSLWGSDAVAAVVHIITRSGRDAQFANGYAEGGSNSTANIGLNGGASAGRWRFGGSIEYLDTDGQNISRSGSEKDGSELMTAALNGTFDATEALTLDVAARFVDATSQFDPVDFVVTGLPTDADIATESAQTYLQAGTSLSSFDGRIVHGLRAHYFDTENDNLTDGVAQSSTAADRLRFVYQADIRLSDNVLSLALEHEKTNFEQRGAVVFGDPNQDQELDVTSYVADFHGSSFERLDWLLSARIDDNSDFDDAVTGRLSLAWSLSNRTTLRANVGTGQKNPTFTERFGFFPGQFIGNPQLKPERSTSYDIGIDQQLGDTLLVQLSFYQQDLEDEINGFVFDPVTFLATAENQSNSSDRSGVELAANWAPSAQLSFSGSYTYTDSSQQDALGVDTRELRRPRHAGSISAAYQFSEERAEVSLTADYSGDSIDVFFPPFPTPSENVTLDGFWLVDLNAQLRFSQTVTGFLRATNLLDEEYEQVFGYRTLGRALYAGLRMNFGR